MRPSDNTAHSNANPGASRPKVSTTSRPVSSPRLAEELLAGEAESALGNADLGADVAERQHFLRPIVHGLPP